jgi:hypothetical protein
MPGTGDEGKGAQVIEPYHFFATRVERLIEDSRIYERG